MADMRWCIQTVKKTVCTDFIGTGQTIAKTIFPHVHYTKYFKICQLLLCDNSYINRTMYSVILHYITAFSQKMQWKIH